MNEDAKQESGKANNQEAEKDKNQEGKNPGGPATQPGVPKDDCKDWPTEDDLPDPPAPPTKKECTFVCKCPTSPTEPTTCFDTLIAAQDKEIKEAERAQSFRDELKALLDKTQAAKLEYTQIKYEALLGEWKKQDRQIVELVRKLICAFPRWRCMADCSVCKLIYEVRDRERALEGSGLPFAPPPGKPATTSPAAPASPASATKWPCYDTADSLYDLQYWHERNRAARKAVFDRVKSVLAAWESPALTIEKALADDAKIITDAQNVMAPDAAKLIYDVFFVLIPRHLAIAPPRDIALTEIQRRYADLLCPCDEVDTPETCCGPNTGPMTLRERLTGPLPYLLAPDLYTKVICCLVEHRYLPAKKVLAAAEGDLANAQSKVNDAKTSLESKTKSLADDAKTNLLAFKWEPQKEGDGDRGGTAKTGGQPPPPPAPDLSQETTYA